MITFKFQWRRNGVDISGETASTYKVVAADIGANVSCVVTATNSYGDTVAETLALIPTSKPRNTVVPVITGTLAVGQTLTSNTGTWIGYPTPTYSYQWVRDGSNIVGANTSTYVLTNSEIDANLYVIVTGTSSVGTNTAMSTNSILRSAPRYTTNNVLTGLTLVGSTLSSNTGAWVGSAVITYSYQWKRNGSNIGGSTSNTYVIVTADIDQSITCAVTAINSQGSNSATSAAVVGTQAPIGTVDPAISGTPTVGQVITSSTGTWTGSATITYTYQWKRNGTSIFGQTASTYTVLSLDLGQSITCTVTATNSIGAASATTAAVTGQQSPINTVSPLISDLNGGTLGLVGHTLSVTTGTWTGYPAPTYSYQWKRNGSNISAATSATYVVAAADVDTTLTCDVTASNILGSATQSSSNSLTGKQAPVNTVLPAVSGTPSVGSTLSSSTGTWTGSATITYTYQWKRNGSNIIGATSSTYIVQTGDVDTSLSCSVIATNPYGFVGATSTSVLAWQAPINTVAPVISGSNIVGSNLSATNGTWTGSVTIAYTYQWKSDGVDISGATSANYTTQATDVGTTVTCVVTGTNGRGSASATTNGIGIIANVVVPNQTFEFGALTKAGQGAYTPSFSGGSIVSASITGGDPSGHWGVDPTGIITPTTAGDTANLNLGPYSLTILFNGATTAVFTINILANTYSVLTTAQVHAIIGTSSDGDLGPPGSLPGARTVALRGSTYDTFNDNTLKNKNWAAPLKITTHTAETVIINDQVNVYTSANLIFDRLSFVVPAANNSCGLKFSNAFANVIIQNCSFYGNVSLTKTSTAYNSVAPNTVFGISYLTGTVGSKLTISNNTFHDLYYGVRGNSDDNHYIQGNYFYDIYGAAIETLQVANSSTLIISDNVIEGILGKTTDSGSPTPIFMAATGNNVNADWDGIKIYRNMLINKYSWATPKGIWIQNINASYYASNTEIYGNVIVNGEAANTGIYVPRAKAVKVKGNTIVSPSFASGSSAPSIRVGETASSGTHILDSNAADAITAFGTTTATNNITLGAKGASVSYASAFDGPTFSINTRIDVLTKLSRKTGGPLDLTNDVGAVGSGFVTWATTNPGNNGSFNGIIPNQTFEFGALTLGSNAAVQINATGVSISSATITSGSGSGVFQVNSTGYITKTANTAALSSPYTLNLSINSGAYNPVITINTTGNDANGRDLSKAYSVNNMTELKTVAELGTIAYGQFILLREGDYNSAQDMTIGVTRSGAPTGTFTPPTLYSVNSDQPPGHKGYNLSTTTSWVTVAPHAGQVPIINRVFFSALSGFRFTNLDFYRPGTAGVTGQYLNVSTPTSISSVNQLDESTAVVSFKNSCDWTVVDNCKVRSTSGSVMASTNVFDVYSGIAGGGDNFLVYESEIYNVFYGHFATGERYDGSHWIGNRYHDVWYDVIRVRPGDNLKINWNQAYDKKSPYAVVGSSASEFLQLVSDNSASNPSANDGQYVGNRVWRGLGSNSTSSTATDGDDFCGITLNRTTLVSDGTIILPTRWMIMGNMIATMSPTTKMLLSMKDSTVRWNTLITHTSNGFLGTLGTGELKVSNGSTNNVIQFNVLESITYETVGDDVLQRTVANNFFVNRTVSGVTANSYNLNFSGALNSTNSVISYPSTPVVLYTVNTNSSAYTNSPKIGAAGTGYIDYSTRTTSFLPIAVESIDFGELTQGGNGAYVVNSGGVTVTTASIVDGSGNYTKLETTVSGGNCYLRKATGDNSSLGISTFFLTISMNSGAAVSQIQVTPLVNTYSVNSVTELISTLQLSTLTLGQNVYCRSGDYNRAKDDLKITRATGITGTFNGTNYVNVLPHVAATPVIWRLGHSGATVKNTPIRFMNLTFQGEVDSLFANSGIFTSIAGGYNMNFANCVFASANQANNTLYAQVPVGLVFTAGQDYQNTTIIDSTFRNLYGGIVASGNTLSIERNAFTGIAGHHLDISGYANTLRVRFNTASKPNQQYYEYNIVTVGVGSPTTVTVSPSDAATFNTATDTIWLFGVTGSGAITTAAAIPGNWSINAGTGVITLTGVNSTGSSFTSGKIRRSGVATSFMMTTSNSLNKFVNNAIIEANILALNNSGNTTYAGPQGYVLSNFAFDRANILGNIYYGAQTNGMSFNANGAVGSGFYVKNSNIKWNTIINTLDFTGPFAVNTAISIAGNAANWAVPNTNIKYNATHTITLPALAANTSNNVIIAASNATEYNAAFVSAKNSSVNSTIPTDLYYKVGGPLDGIVIKVGAATDYVNWTTNGTSFPADISANADSTAVKLDTWQFKADKV